MSEPIPRADLALNPCVREDSAALLSAVLQASDYGILMSTLDRQDLVANRRLGEMFALTPEEVVRMAPDAVRQLARVRFRDPEAFERLLDQIYADPSLARADELELAGDPPRVLRRYTGPVRNQDGEPIGRLWTFLDVTETKRLQAEAQAELERRTAEYQATATLLQAMNHMARIAAEQREDEALLAEILEVVQGVLGFRRGALLLQTPGGECFAGLARVGSRTERFEIAARHDPELEAALARNPGQPSLEASPAMGRGGPVRRLLGAKSLAWVPLASEGRTVGVLVVGTDHDQNPGLGYREAHVRALLDQVALTLAAHRLQADLREAMATLQATQRQMIEIERLRTAGALAASVAHDIRNILTPLQVELATQPEAIPEAVRHPLNRFFALTHRLLAFSRPDVLDFTPVALEETIQGVIPLLEGYAHVNGVRISLDLPAGLPAVAADARQLEHLFVNLFLNGIQAMAVAGGELAVSAREEKEMVRVRVADTGCGIESADLDRLFEPFFTRRANGTGLGLFSCRRIVEMHAGELSVESSPGEGTCFTVRLPAGRRSA